MTQQQPQAKYRRDYKTPDYTITDLDLDFVLDADCTTVTAVSQVTRLGSPGAVLVLDGEALTLRSLSVDGVAWTEYRTEGNQLIVDGLPAQFTLTIVNEIHPAQNSALEGLYQSGEALCTQCEAEGFRHITYYLDRPDVLARFRTRIVADKARYPYLLSNGNRVGQGELEDGRHWVQWEDPFPKPSYLFALVAGDFDRLSDTFITRSGRRVALELYVDRGNLDRTGWAMTSLKNAMRWDEQRFGLEYDLDIYMVVAVDFFNMGAMENKGLNIFNAKFVLAKAQTATDKDYLNIESVIGHEYFHNWTGNRVTCRDWFQLSLKEGLTVFRDQEFSSDLGSRAVNRIDNVRVLRGAQFAEDAGPMAHPIRPDKVIEMNNFYTLTVYEKGAEVIRMMHTLLGEEKFQAGMRLYFTRHDGSAATCDDFVQAMEDASGIDLTLFRRWYSQSGTPLLTVRDEYDAERRQYRLYVTQTTPATADQVEKRPLHIPLDIELYNDQGEVIPLMMDGAPAGNVLSVTEAEQSFAFDNVPQAPTPSLLREFSAPVRLEYPYSDRQLTFLMQHARNDFARWDAAQMLLAKYVRLNVSRSQQGQPLSLPEHVMAAFGGVLADESQDPALRAQILTLPSEVEMAELFSQIDPEAIALVHQALTRLLAQQLAAGWLHAYQRNATPEYRIEHGDIARRALRNVCLRYLAFGDDVAQADALVSAQYRDADNMTDALGALSAAVAAQLPCRDTLMAQFDQRWHQDGLVMDKWFTLQATAPDDGVLAQVRALLQHRSFTLSNPNRTRALVGAFAQLNPRAFHAADGSGYAFLAEILADLNTRNPQVAARMVDPLIRLKRYDAGRQALMRQQLESLLALESLSGDLYEKITRALEA
ncbi:MULTISPECIES: aminopeptidase N [Edwardsiella]|uniref:Aminopeptidase N n=2 Tax=Edwardsiella anguillarum TaxID=1821960 RepID=A0A076LP17_9GAMM|nr:MULTISPECIES: aminopeptidase N [Edwardsiella]AIJ09616.1 Membrane alanine aminopeptidase N [Edwardsiella anguillarum ET080813]AKR77371.1 aminopeptidase N [Edwardsiella sp. LADL05-105]KAB0592589.1 aminopeptidase N [Edwardsiella anguillarum]UOU80402.1 aminopeptidase N [Edwardsiella anguillarum]WHP85090.1 aminopeptidase N [Edwardsiella anguillarum]